MTVRVDTREGVYTYPGAVGAFEGAVFLDVEDASDWRDGQRQMSTDEARALGRALLRAADLAEEGRGKG